MSNWDYDDYDDDIDIHRIKRLYQLRHACNVLGGDFVIKANNWKEDRVVMLYESDIHGSTPIKQFFNLTDEKFKQLFEKFQSEAEVEIQTRENAEYKNFCLIQDLEEKRKTFANLGTNISKRRLNKLAKSSSRAKAIRLALEIEDKNICAKKTYGEYRDRTYKQKYELILELCKLFQEQNWTYGIQDCNNYSASNVIYFEIPECEQLSWHINPSKEHEFPKYTKEWDRKENSTLLKLEIVTINLLTENNLHK